MLLTHLVVAPRSPSEEPPLLVLLHGIGADEEDLLPLVPYLDPRLLVVSARAPQPAEPRGHRWYPIDWSVTPPRADPAEIAASCDLLGRFVAEAVAEFRADPARVFLLGFSQGAVLSLCLLLARPGLLRGVVAHSGRLARLPGPAPDPEALSRVEVLLLHGALDAIIPVEQARKAREVLAPLLGARVTYREFEDLAHAISDESLAEAARWLSARLDAGPAAP